VSFTFTQRVGGRQGNGKCIAQTKKNRHKHACKRTVTPGTITFTAHAGTNKVAFQGRISSSKKLPPGTYTLIITAANVAGQAHGDRGSKSGGANQPTAPSERDEGDAAGNALHAPLCQDRDRPCLRKEKNGRCAR
jgi:hypothetical protein